MGFKSVRNKGFFLKWLTMIKFTAPKYSEVQPFRNGYHLILIVETQLINDLTLDYRQHPIINWEFSHEIPAEFGRFCMENTRTGIISMSPTLE